jgi:hypothetical protein
MFKALETIKNFFELKRGLRKVLVQIQILEINCRILFDCTFNRWFLFDELPDEKAVKFKLLAEFAKMIHIKNMRMKMRPRCFEHRGKICFHTFFPKCSFKNKVNRPSRKQIKCWRVMFTNISNIQISKPKSEPS